MLPPLLAATASKLSAVGDRNTSTPTSTTNTPSPSAAPCQYTTTLCSVATPCRRSTGQMPSSSRMMCAELSLCRARRFRRRQHSCRRLLHLHVVAPLLLLRHPFHSSLRLATRRSKNP